LSWFNRLHEAICDYKHYIPLSRTRIQARLKEGSGQRRACLICPHNPNMHGKLLQEGAFQTEKCSIVYAKLYELCKHRDSSSHHSSMQQSLLYEQSIYLVVEILSWPR
jgi:hypothetical protein